MEQPCEILFNRTVFSVPNNPHRLRQVEVSPTVQPSDQVSPRWRLRRKTISIKMQLQISIFHLIYSPPIRLVPQNSPLIRIIQHPYFPLICSTIHLPLQVLQPPCSDKIPRLKLLRSSIPSHRH